MNDIAEHRRQERLSEMTDDEMLAASDAMDRLIGSLFGSEVGLTDAEALVLVKLGLYAVVGAGRPTDAALAERMGKSERHLCRLLRSLVEKGWLADTNAMPVIPDEPEVTA